MTAYTFDTHDKVTRPDYCTCELPWQTQTGPLKDGSHYSSCVAAEAGRPRRSGRGRPGKPSDCPSEASLRRADEPTDVPAEMCRGFHWIGQPFTSCDTCGRPAWEHEGMDEPDGPFSDTSTIRQWEPGEAEAIRTKWADT